MNNLPEKPDVQELPPEPALPPNVEGNRFLANYYSAFLNPDSVHEYDDHY